MRKTRLRSISDKKAARLKEQGLPITSFSAGAKKKAKSRTSAVDTSLTDAYRKARELNVTKYGELTCEFCRQPILGGLHHHHVAGRVGSLKYNPNGLWVAHPECHSVGPNSYHELPLSDQINCEWFSRLLATIKAVDMAKYSLLLGKAKEVGYDGD